MMTIKERHQISVHTNLAETPGKPDQHLNARNSKIDKFKTYLEKNLMKKKQHLFILVSTISILLTIACQISADSPGENDFFDWPRVTSENKPWSYWWWMGSAVDKQNLTGVLEQYQKAGLGGMHIIPIYGVKGEEEKFIDFLSPEWIEMLNHTISEAERLHMGVDMTSGTGWNFGGPQVSIEDAASGVVVQTFSLSKGESLDEKLIAKDGLDPKHENLPQTVMAFSEQNEILDLTGKVDKTGMLDWIATEGDWKLYAVYNAGIRGAVVERGAPGGKGYMVNPFSEEGIVKYLERFDKAFLQNNAKKLRAFYHDSYEYHHATWAKDFLQQFEKRRGYDLRLHLPALFGEDTENAVARVRYDYRKTIAELHLAYITYWAKWAKEKGALTRNQAHGSPTNILDVYAAADIPETEFQHPSYFDIPGMKYYVETTDIPNIPMMKFSSSAAHISGKNLTSSESCTWLDEHFKVSLAQIKPEIDQLFIAGINHVFYHGIAYSPLDAEWPGWLFYASTNFDASNSFFYDFPYLNQYITRCQSILQAGKPDNDVLLYYPIADLWNQEQGVHKRFGDLVMPTQVHYIDNWLANTSFYNLSEVLLNKGYSFDYLSDQFLTQCVTKDNAIVTGNNEYRTILVPSSTYMTLPSFRKILDLAASGANIVFEKKLPEDVPGMYDLSNRRAELRKLQTQLKWEVNTKNDRKIARVGKGRLILAENAINVLNDLDLSREELASSGVNFIRRTHSDGYHYFATVLQNREIDGWVTLGRPAASVIIMDAVNGRTGLARIRQKEDGRTQIYLQLKPGESCLLRTMNKRIESGPDWQYRHPKKESHALSGNWQIKFIQGGPVLPQSYSISNLQSWTENDDPETERFAGTARYSLNFTLPDVSADGWLLDIGRVAESARIRINGKMAGVLFSHPFVLQVGEFLQQGENQLEIDVTNLSANRIRDLDRRNVNWRKFYDINYVNIYYKPFDASGWDIQDSGLLGPVQLIPLTKKTQIH